MLLTATATASMSQHQHLLPLAQPDTATTTPHESDTFDQMKTVEPDCKDICITWRKCL